MAARKLKLKIMFFGKFLSLSHTRWPSVGFRAACQRQYKILLPRPVCRVYAARQLVLISVASVAPH